MKRKTAYLVINPRLGRKITRLTDMIAVFSAAGWKTEVALKEFGGHTKQLATMAAEAGYDLVIGCGGDGTINQVVNGVMAAKNRSSTVGVIPGGTMNVWAHEIGLPEDPVAAALSLVNSEARKVDLGHVEVESLTFPSTSKDRRQAVSPPTDGVNHFLLMAGLGTDAAIMREVPTPLKEKLGAAAAAVTAAKEFATHEAFPIEIRSSEGGRKGALLWKGDAHQVVVGNTRRYANMGEATPDAHIDDGVLDVLVITAGSPLATMQQFVSFLVRRKPSTGSSEHFRGAHIWITAPASVHMQLDGSAVELEDSLNGPDCAAVKKHDPKSVMVTYRFDAMPRALRMAIPYSYDDALFEAGPSEDKTQTTEHQIQDQEAAHVELESSSQNDSKEPPKKIGALLEKGRKVKVVGVVPNPKRKGTYIVAGAAFKNGGPETKPVAVRIDDDTTLFRRTGEKIPPGVAAGLREGEEIVVEGKTSKRGVVRAKRIVVD